MKANHPARQPHRHHVNRLIGADPAKPAEEKLQPVRTCRNGHGQGDPKARQDRHPGQAVEFLRQLQMVLMFTHRA